MYYRQVNPRPFRRGFTFIAVRFILLLRVLAISTERIKANAYVLCMCVSVSVSFCCGLVFLWVNVFGCCSIVGIVLPMLMAAKIRFFSFRRASSLRYLWGGCFSEALQGASKRLPDELSLG